MTDWSRLVEQYGQVVWRTAWRLLGNEADASDCFQETFVSAVELSRRETVVNWPALLKRLATVRGLDLLRRRMSHRDRHDDSVDHASLPDHIADPLQQAEAGELAERLREAIGKLPRRQAAVFCLRCLDELSYEEIGQELGITANAAGVLLHKARNTLRRRLAPASCDPARK